MCKHGRQYSVPVGVCSASLQIGFFNKLVFCFRAPNNGILLLQRRDSYNMRIQGVRGRSDETVGRFFDEFFVPPLPHTYLTYIAMYYKNIYRIICLGGIGVLHAHIVQWFVYYYIIGSDN